MTFKRFFSCRFVLRQPAPTPCTARSRCSYLEESEYEVIRPLDKVEVRQQVPCIVAEVVLDTRTEDAGNEAFPILAGNIFGKNKDDKKSAMTAPATQAAVAGGMRVQFVRPKEVTMATAPEPLDTMVRFRQ